MKIGIEADAYWLAQENRIDYKKMKEHGYECVDINTYVDPKHPTYSMNDEELAAFCANEKAQADEAGIEIYQVHAVWPTDDTTEENCDLKFKWLITNIKMCSFLKCSYLVMHPYMPYGWGGEPDPQVSFDVNLHWFRKLIPIAEEHNVILCFENMPFRRHAISPVKRSCEFVDEINSKSLGICFDTGHAMMFGDQAGDMVRLIGKRLLTLHVHDNDGNTDFHLLPCADGIIDWEDFRAALQEIGYDGCLSLETGPNKELPPDELEEARRKLAKTALYLAGRE